jgi:tetratricopeptide (TPR) repeat protein
MTCAGNQKEWTPRHLHLFCSLLVVAVFAGSAFERNSIWQDPVSLWEDAARKSPRTGRIYNNLGEAYHKKGQIAKALESYYQAIRVSPASSLDAYGNIGSIYVSIGEYEKAVQIFSQLLMIDQNDAMTYASRGHAYHQQGSYESAIQDFSKSLLLSPRQSTVYLYRGLSYEKRGNSSAADQDFRSACALGEAGACTRFLSQ